MSSRKLSAVSYRLSGSNTDGSNLALGSSLPSPFISFNSLAAVLADIILSITMTVPRYAVTVGFAHFFTQLTTLYIRYANAMTTIAMFPLIRDTNRSVQNASIKPSRRRPTLTHPGFLQGFCYCAVHGRGYEYAHTLFGAVVTVMFQMVIHHHQRPQTVWQGG